MKKIQTIFLQAVIMLIGIGVFAFMLLEPLREGRNAHATLFQVYFNDLFLAYAYTASISFFFGLYKAFVLLGYIRHNKAFTPDSVKALRTIKYCFRALVAFIAAPLAYLFIVRPGDDIAGGVAMGLFLIFVSTVIAVIADVSERLFQSAVDMKPKNDTGV